MSERCVASFPEELLSGYLDGALTQGDEQRVRIHLEDCESCRGLYRDLSQLREVTMSTRFEMPRDDQWKEVPRGAASRLSFGLGWFLVGAWILGVSGFVLWQMATGPEGILEKLLVFGGLSGAGLLVLSVVLDRLKTYKTDRYRRVEK